MTKPEDKSVFQRFMDYELHEQNVVAEMQRCTAQLEFPSTEERAQFLGFSPDLFAAWQAGDIDLPSLLIRMLIRCRLSAESRSINL